MNWAEPGRVERFGPDWNSRPVVVFGGQYDTHRASGEDYGTRTLASLFTLEPGDKPKAEGLAFIPSSYCGHDAREHAVQRERGSFVALTGDVDCGNHPLPRIESLVRAFAGDSAWLVFSSAHARPGDMRWRIILPLDAPVPFSEWHDAQHAFFNFMESAGVEMDRALDRAAQPVYLPNVPYAHARTGEMLRNADGPLHYARATTGGSVGGLRLDGGLPAAGMAAIRNQRAADDIERERIRREAEKRRASRPVDEGQPIIAEFSKANSLANLLELYGYKQSPRNGDDWRSPHQTGESYATRVMGDKWVSLSASDAGAGLGETFKSGCFGDAYDLFVHYEHKGDHKAAFRELHRERKAGNPVPAPKQRAPQPMHETFDPETGEIIEAPLPARCDTALPLIWYADNQPFLSGNWLVKGLLPAEAFCTVIGHPGCGKSFFALDLALHIAAGMRWQDRKTAKGLVIYLAAEGQRGQQNRVEAWKRHYEAQDVAFAMIPVAVNLRDEKADLPKLCQTIADACALIGLPLSCLVVDTLNRTFGGGDENGTDMSEYVANVGKIQAQFGCTCIVVHHIPKNADTVSERGHGSLRGAIETSLVISTDAESGIRTMVVKKQKDAEDGWKLQFKLRVVELGEDEDGDPVTSCVVVPAEGEVGPTRERGPSMSPTQRQALNELLATMEAHPVGLPSDFPAERRGDMRNGRVTSRKIFQERWAAIAASDLSPASAAATFRRAVTDLQNKGMVGSWNDFIWATNK